MKSEKTLEKIIGEQVKPSTNQDTKKTELNPLKAEIPLLSKMGVQILNCF